MRTVSLALVALIGVSLNACESGDKSAAQQSSAPASSATAIARPAGTAAAAFVSGTVAETMDAGGYTYVLVDDGTKKIWAAGPQTAVAKGARVELPAGSLMQNFTSNTLKKTFPEIYFVSAIKTVKE